MTGTLNAAEMSIPTSTVLPDPSPSPEKISIQLPKTSQSWLGFIAVWSVWALILFLAVKLLVIWMNNRPLLKWWQDGDKTKRFNNIISLWLILSYTQGNYFLYGIQSLFLAPAVQLSKAQIYFIEGSLFPYQTYLDPVTNKPGGILTPTQLCGSVLLHPNDDDANTPGFVAWLKAHPDRKQGPTGAQDSSFFLTFKGPNLVNNKTVSGHTLYDFDATPIKDTDKFGVYPCSSSTCTTAWQGCIQAWLNGGIGAQQEKKWYWTQDANSVWYTIPINPDDPDNYKAWFDVEAQPDNFLARYAIMPESPLVVYFANGTVTSGGVKADPIAFENLVSNGGWVGFLNGLGSAASLDDIKALCFAKVDLKAIPPLKPCDQNKPLTSTLAGASAFGSSMMMAFFAPEAQIPIFAASLLMGALSATSAAVSKSC